MEFPQHVLNCCCCCLILSLAHGNCVCMCVYFVYNFNSIIINVGWYVVYIIFS